jgi:hypothetical protein
MSSGSECQGGEGFGYDVQRRLLEAAGYDLSAPDGDIEIMDGSGEKPADPSSAPAESVEPEASAEERMPVSVYFGERALHIASGEAFRPCFWTSGRRPDMTSKQTAVVRRASTLAILGNPETTYITQDMRRWISDAGLSEPDYYRVASRVRTWWRNGLRILGSELILIRRKGMRDLTFQANPNMDFTFSEVPLGDENTSRRATY